MMVTREVREGDWEEIKKILSDNFSEKETKRRIKYLRKMYKKSIRINVKLVDLNIVGFSSEINNRKEEYQSNDWRK